MKKIIAAFLCLILMIGITACGDNKTENITDPAADENNISEPERSTLSLAGFSCEYIKAETREDISGLLKDGSPVFKADSDNTASIEVYADDEVKAARWFNRSMQHCIVVKDGGALERSEFLSFVTQQQEISLYGMTHSEMLALFSRMAGVYVWEDGGRHARLNITAGSEKAECAIYWLADEKTSYLWTMTAAFSSDGLLCYDDGLMAEIDFSTNPKGDSEVIMQAMTGCFEIKDDGSILWPHGGPDGESPVFTKE